MRRLFALAVLSTLLYAAPAGAQVTHIRAGMSAGGVDLSGLTVPDATAKLNAELAPRLAPDLLIGVAGKPWTLKMADAKLKFDADRTAKRALYAKAGVTQVAPAISHSRLAVKAFVEDIAKKLARVYKTVITIDKAHFKLRLFKGLKFRKSYGVAVGQPAYPTPSGRFAIQDKQVNPVWSVPNSPWAGELQGTTVEGGSAANPLKARWMGIANGVGIHGTGEDWSIGTRASHGCIRMHVADVIDLFKRVPVGAPVLIQ
jgi:hypothetical protein